MPPSWLISPKLPCYRCCGLQRWFPAWRAPSSSLRSSRITRSHLRQQQHSGMPNSHIKIANKQPSRITRPNDIAQKWEFASELYHSSTIDIERHKDAAAFGFGIHQFANNVGSLQFVLGWNRQTRSDYLFVVSRLMKIRLILTRKTGHWPGRCATNKQI